MVRRSFFIYQTICDISLILSMYIFLKLRLKVYNTVQFIIFHIWENDLFRKLPDCL
ncbi:Uncharacterised protein [Mycobacteroides abscessus subsp. abscessus]|nr:Uncharacterised protein [Mycobacteroides abscessus subsp. abscessus]